MIYKPDFDLVFCLQNKLSFFDLFLSFPTECAKLFISKKLNMRGIQMTKQLTDTVVLRHGAKLDS